MIIRERIEENERKNLSNKAALSSQSKGRVRQEAPCPIRTIYMRDRDRILHSEAFRRLKHKTQVFFIATNDLYRTRLTHTLEVSGIARTIAKALRLNEDLTEAIALGHDLGHPPFGHIGEEVLNELYPNGFRHNVQSLRMVDRLEGGKGLNLSFEVRDGILKHSKGIAKDIWPTNPKEQPITLEGQIVRISDRISYLNHDIDDALRSELLKMEDIPKSILSILGERHSQRINTMVNDVVFHSEGKDIIVMSTLIRKEMEHLKNFLFEKVYNHPKILDESSKAKKILKDLYNFFKKNPSIILQKTSHISYSKTVPSSEAENLNGLAFQRRIIDYLAMMTDNFALRAYQKYLTPKKWF